MLSLPENIKFWIRRAPIDKSRVRNLVLQEPVQSRPQIPYHFSGAFGTLKSYAVTEHDDFLAGSRPFVAELFAEKYQRQRVHHRRIVHEVGRRAHFKVVHEQRGLENAFLAKD